MSKKKKKLKNMHSLANLTEEEQHILHKRHAQENRFRFFGKAAAIISIAIVVFLFVQIFTNGIGAFTQTEIKIPIYFDKKITAKTSYSKIIKKSLLKKFPDAKKRKEKFMLYAMVSKSAARDLKALVENNELDIEAPYEGKNTYLWVLASSYVDMYRKGNIDKELPEKRRKIKDKQITWYDDLTSKDELRTVFNTNFFTKGDSREPELAGVLGGLVGSLFVIIVCMLVSFPIGVGAAIYLEEFAPKNRFTDLIEVNINNLAAVPSIIFGLLALAIYLNFFGLPRSSSFVGGLALSLMVLPTIVITTRNSLQAIPPSIRYAALAMGATKVQVTLHHTLQYALPGIMTGTILSIARALGETAPLLMVGMVAFVVDIPTSIFEPATSLPTQIFLWADSPEMGFVEKTSACIIVLLIILIIVNLVAAYIRNKFEYEW